MTDLERAYDYKPKWWAILLLGGYFALGAVFLGHKASGNDPDNLPGLYWVCCALGVAGVALAGVGAVDRLFFRRRVVLTQACLLLPRSVWSAEEVAIEYRAITGLSVSGSKQGGARYLHVTYPGGKRRIAASL